MLTHTGVSDKLNGGRDESDDDALLERAGSPKAQDEESLSPASRELAPVSPSEGNLLGAEAEGVSSTTGSASSRKKHLLKQLEEIEAAIARKKKTTV